MPTCFRARREIGRESEHRVDPALRPNFEGQSGRGEFQLLNVDQPGAVMIVRHHGDAVPAGPHTAARNRVFPLGAPVSRSLHPGRTDRLPVEEGRIDIVDDAELQLKLPAGKLRRQLETQAADITTGPGKNRGRPGTRFPAGVVELRSQALRSGFSAGVKTLEPAEQRFEIVSRFQRIPDALLLVRRVVKRLPAHRLEFLPGDPCGDVGAAPGRGDQADRNIEVLQQLPAEKVAAGRKVRRRLRIADLPAETGLVRQRPLRRQPAGQHGVVKPDSRIIRMPELLFGIQGPEKRILRKNRHLHIGLAGAHPDFADQDRTTGALPAAPLTVNTCGPPASIAGNSALHSPSGPATAFRLRPAKATSTAFPGSAVPEMTTGRSR